MMCITAVKTVKAVKTNFRAIMPGADNDDDNDDENKSSGDNGYNDYDCQISNICSFCYNNKQWWKSL